MRIAQSNLALQGSRQYFERLHTEDSLQFEVRAPTPPPQASTRVELSDSAQATSAQPSGDTSEAAKGLDMRLQILADIIERITGRKVVWFDASDLDKGAEQTDNAASTSEAHDAPARPADPEWSLHISHSETQEAAQLTKFAASGKMQTADGREISFSLDLEMARYERLNETTTVDAGNIRRKDPLVLNLRGGAAQLGENRISFDLDNDGQADSIAPPVNGSVFLAIDRNGNGKIDDGSELFGPASGDGFAELSQLDADGNGWIDEGDAAFSSLKTWSPDTGLRSLAADGVGAISVQQAATPFSLASSDKDPGAIRSTGIFLHEDGTPGTIQHVDLTV